jgi:pSer/pThr/pTyr-binding forkhead associated (FHA) protein
MASRNTKSAPATTRPVLIPRGPHARKPSLALSRAVTLIGARQNAHLHLVSSSVSKAHALVLNTGGGIYVRDLASRTHLYINDEQVREAFLQDGDVLRIGSFQFKFVNPFPGDQPVPPAPPAELQVDGEPLPLPIEERVVLIGRRPGSDVPLVESSVSIAHALVFEVDGKRYIRDLGSRTGTWVNGRKIHHEELAPGDQIRIGETSIRYIARAAAAAEAPPLLEPAAQALELDEPPVDDLAAASGALAAEPRQEAPLHLDSPAEDELELDHPDGLRSQDQPPLDLDVDLDGEPAGPRDETQLHVHADPADGDDLLAAVESELPGIDLAPASEAAHEDELPAEELVALDAVDDALPADDALPSDEELPADDELAESAEPPAAEARFDVEEPPTIPTAEAAPAPADLDLEAVDRDLEPIPMVEPDQGEPVREEPQSEAKEDEPVELDAQLDLAQEPIDVATADETAEPPLDLTLPDEAVAEEQEPLEPDPAAELEPQEPVPVSELEEVDFSSLHLDLKHDETSADAADEQALGLDPLPLAGGSEEDDRDQAHQPLLDLAEPPPPSATESQPKSSEIPLLAPDALDDLPAPDDAEAEAVGPEVSEADVIGEVRDDTANVALTREDRETEEPAIAAAPENVEPTADIDLEARDSEPEIEPVHEVIEATEPTPEYAHDLELAADLDLATDGSPEAPAQQDEWSAARDAADALTDTSFAAAVERFTPVSAGPIIEHRQEERVEELPRHVGEELNAAQPPDLGFAPELSTQEPVEVDQVLPQEDQPQEPLPLDLDQVPEPEQLRLDPPAIEQAVEQIVSEAPELEMPSGTDMPASVGLAEESDAAAMLNELAAQADELEEPLHGDAVAAVSEVSAHVESPPASWGANQDGFLGGLPLHLEQRPQVGTLPHSVDAGSAASAPREGRAIEPGAPGAEKQAGAAAVPPPAMKLPRRKRPLMPPAPTYDPAESGFDTEIPPADGFSCGVEEFAGLGEAGIREVDVFSQLAPADIDESVFANPTATDPQSGEPPESPRRQRPPLPMTHHAAGAGGEAVSAATSSARAQQRRPVSPRSAHRPRTAVPVATPPPSAPKKRRWRFFSIPVLVFLMFVSLLASATAIYALVPIRYTIQGEIKYTNMDALTVYERDLFQSNQRSAFERSENRVAARTILRQQHPEVDPGFLDSSQAAAIAFSSSAHSATWRKSTFEFRHTGTDEDGDKLRVHALMQALYEHNKPLIDQAAESQRRLDSLREAIAESRQSLQTIDARMKQEEEKAADGRRLVERQARLQAELEQLTTEARAAAQAAAAARVELDAHLALLRRAEATASANGARGDESAAGPLAEKTATLEAVTAQRQQHFIEIQDRVYELENELKSVRNAAAEARGAADRLIEFQRDRSVRQQELNQREATLHTEQARLAAAVQQVMPLDDHVRTERVTDPRPTYAAVSFGAIFAVFAVLLLMSTMYAPSVTASSRQDQARETGHDGHDVDLQVRPSDMEPEAPEETEVATTGDEVDSQQFADNIEEPPVDAGRRA